MNKIIIELVDILLPADRTKNTLLKRKAFQDLLNKFAIQIKEDIREENFKTNDEIQRHNSFICENDGCDYIFKNDEEFELLDEHRSELGKIRFPTSGSYLMIFCPNCKLGKNERVIETTEKGFRFVESI